MKKIVVVYQSGAEKLKIMANVIAREATINGGEVKLLSIEQVTKETVVDSEVLIFGCSVERAGVIDKKIMKSFIALLEGMDFVGKKVALFGSCDWGNEPWVREWIKKMKGYNTNIIADGLVIRLTVDVEGIQECKKLGEMLVMY